MSNFQNRDVKVLTSPSELKHSGVYLVKSEIVFPQTDEFLVDFSDLVEHCSAQNNAHLKEEDVHYGLVIAEDVTLIFEGGCFTTSLNLKMPRMPISAGQGGLGDLSTLSQVSKFYLIGNNTVLKAGPEQIFGDSMEVTGPWITERSYPQWFDQLAGKQKGVHAFRGDREYYKHLHDCSAAINKAVRFKGVGEVFLPQGNYYISHPIKLPIGITLTGETYRNMSADTEDEELFKIWNDRGWFDEDCACVGSIIIPFIESVVANKSDNAIATEYSTPFDRGIFRINLEEDKKNGDNKDDADDDWVAPFPLNVSAMKDLAIFNMFYTEEIRFSDIAIKNHIEIARKECCVIAGGYTFQNVKWYNFPMAIKWTGHYTDLRKITDCSIQLHPNIRNAIDSLKDGKRECMYLITIPFLGDALQITHLCTDAGSFNPEEQQFFKGIYVCSCHGGSISDCIINMDVVLRGCIGVTFRNNHMENGAQVLIQESIVDVTGNHFEKGSRPSLLFEVPESWNMEKDRSPVDESNVIVSGNYFMTYTLRSDASEQTAQRTPIKKVNPYDIVFDKKFGGVFNVRLTANYRYSHNELGSLQPTGIMLGLVDYSSGEPAVTPFEEFNKYSYFLSDECQIHEGFKLDFYREFNKIPHISGGSVMNNSGVPFVNESAFPKDLTVDGSSQSGNDGGMNDELFPDPFKEVYEYKAQPILDAERQIAGVEAKIFSINLDAEGEPKAPTDNKHGSGVLISLAATTAGTPCMLRLIKKVTNTKGENAVFYVEIPIVGGEFLYDNGYSVNCYPWIKVQWANSLNADDIIKNVLTIKPSDQTGIKRVSFMGDNVKAFVDSSTLPNAYGWKVTDELINISAGNAGHYCVGLVNGQKKWIKL